MLGADEIVSGLERLGESPEVTIPLRQYLRPALATLPMYYGLLWCIADTFIHISSASHFVCPSSRKILQELVSAGDLDGDGGLSWEEVEAFGNFEFVANWFG